MIEWSHEQHLELCKVHQLEPNKKWHYKSGGFMIWCPNDRCTRIIDNYQNAHSRWNEKNKKEF